MHSIKALVLALLLVSGSLFGQQFTPPTVPGMKSAHETVQGEVLKVYSLDDKGHKFRAYVTKYKGTEVIVSDELARSQHKVGDKITFLAVRVEAPLAGKKVASISFKILNVPTPKAP